MFDRVVMDVIHMAGEVGFIADLMFPISMLPDGLFALLQARRIGRAPVCIRAMLGERALDQTPASREIRIVRRQRPDAVKMVKHDHDGVDLERTRSANGAESIAKYVDGFSRSQNRPAAIRHEGEEDSAAGNDCASIVHGWCRVTLR